jgi:copper chaperone CopZ
MSRTITVEGMTCEHCEETVETALEEVEGVSGATADRETETVTIEGSADDADLLEAVETAGYEPAV